MMRLVSEALDNGTHISRRKIIMKNVKNSNTKNNTSQANKAKQNVQTKQQQQQIRTKVNRVGSDESALQSYELALSMPFDKSAIGATVPDMYSYPTATYHAEGTTTLSSNASGVISVLLLPHPFLSMVDMTGTSVNTSGMQQYLNTTVAYAATTQANLAGELTNFRVVGCGYKIRNLLPPTTATGRIIVAPVPVSGLFPGPSLLATAAGNNNNIAAAAIGVNTGSLTNGFGSDILELPAAEEFTVQDVIANSIHLNCQPVTPAAFDFHNSLNFIGYNAADNLVGGNAYVITTGTIAAGNDAISSESAIGWDAYMLRAEGLPISVTNCLEIEYVIHYEGTPKLPSGAGTLAPGAAPKPHINLLGHMSVLSRVLNRPPIKLATDIVGRGISGYKALMSGDLGGAVSAGSSIFAKLGLTL
jgi:hypothetical protein